MSSTVVSAGQRWWTRGFGCLPSYDSLRDEKRNAMCQHVPAPSVRDDGERYCAICYATLPEDADDARTG